MAKGAGHQRRESAGIPRITSIDQMETILPRYVWVDEDGNQVSPIHKELRSAFHFVNGWQERWDRLSEWADPTTLSKSGKPPVELKRLEIDIRIEEPTDEEKTLASVMLGRK